MAGVSKYTYTTLKQAILDYTEVEDTVFTTTILDGFIMSAEFRINQDLPTDSDRFVQEGSLAANDNTINAPAGTLFVRGIEVFNSTANTEGNGSWLEKKDQSYLSELTDRKFGPSGQIQAPTDTTSGGMYLAPTPDANYKFRIYYNKMPTGLGSGTTGSAETYLSTYFPQGLLYACLVEAFAFLKGPMEMLTLYENKYKSSIQQFAGMQLGRRRRDDYTDGTVRIPVKSPSP